MNNTKKKTEKNGHATRIDGASSSGVLWRANGKAPFIVLEGGEGSGKSSALRELKDILGDRIVTIREPGGTEYGEVIRDVAIKHPKAKEASPHATMCLMFAGRFENLFKVIEPAQKAGKPTFSDRLDASSFAYNVEAQTGGMLGPIFWSMREQFPVLPSGYIFFDVDPREGIRRARARNAAEAKVNGKTYDKFDNRELAFHQAVRNGYLKFFERVPHIVIDANRPQEIVIADFIRIARELIGM